MNARYAQMKRPQVVTARSNREAALESAAIHVSDLQSGLLAASVSNDAAIHQGKKLLNVLVVQAQDGRPVERHLLNKLEECGADLHNGRIVIQVLAIDVRNHGQDRAQLQERSIALVR